MFHIQFIAALFISFHMSVSWGFLTDDPSTKCYTMTEKAKLIINSLSSTFGNHVAFQESKLKPEYGTWPENRIEQMAIDIFKRIVKEQPEFDEEMRGDIYKNIRNTIIEIKTKSFVDCFEKQ